MYFNSYDSSGDPLSSLGVLIVVVYFAAYAIGFSTGRSRVFKWIAGGALVVFVFLFSQILDSSFGPFAGLFFLLILPVAGWSVPFAFGGLTRRICDHFGWYRTVRIGVAILGSIALPALFLCPILFKDSDARLAEWRGRPDYAKCAEIDMEGILEDMHLRLPINPMLDLTAETPGVLEGYVEGVTSYRLDSERSARKFCADRSPIALRSIGISTSKYYTDAGEKWLTDNCDKPASSVVDRMCRMRRLGDVGGGSAGFTLQKMSPSARQEPTYQEILRKNHFESEDVYLSDEDGYRILKYLSSGGFVGVLEQVRATRWAAHVHVQLSERCIGV